MFFDLPRDILKKIYEYDSTYHDLHKSNLKFLQRQWSVKYINKITGSWGWDITLSNSFGKSIYGHNFDAELTFFQINGKFLKTK